MPKRVLQGVVVSDKQDKTVVVKVERRFTHPVLKKTVRRSKNFHAHDEANSAKVGDTVQIQESRPYSKLKTWELVTGASQGGDKGQGLVGSVVSAVKSAVGLSDKG
jgi:small subunit ribosomal protein S17